MKCEQHGVEMEWRGSLAAGRMYCEHCASTGGRSYADIAKELLGGFDVAAPGTTDKTVGQIYADALDPGRRSTAAIAQTLREAEYRVRQADYMLDIHYKGGRAYCPYCNKDTDPGHTNTPVVSPCEGSYNADKSFIRRHKP